jgi:D-beta-D-heptose 7-phosphate kinase/D-beta-D-heptose 1-phosphate adenosyltransferase
LDTLAAVRAGLRRRRKRVVFTNGTFDILHRGHVEYLAAARHMGDVLMVGLNNDASVRRLKGRGRPINPARDRAAVLAALASVDYVCLFGQDTPASMIRRLEPDVLVKGADWKKSKIVGRDTVRAHGGSVRTVRLTAGRSTSGMIRRVLRAYGKNRRR